MRHYFAIGYLALLFAAAQYISTAYTPSTSSGPTPGFVNETGANSTLTDSVTTIQAGWTGCPNNTDCIPYADTTLSANLGVVFWTADNTTTTETTATATDDKSNTYTCLAGSVDSTSKIGNGACYAPNMASGAHLAKVTWGTTAQTQVQAKAQQFYNIATSSPVEAHTSCAAATTTSPGCGSVTTTVANDLVDVEFCALGATLAAPITITPGTGFTLGTVEPQDGCMTEYEVDSGTGSITPVATFSATSAYIEYVIAFKAASAGTAPTGTYLAHLTTYSTVSPATEGNLQMQSVNRAGDLLAITNSCHTITVSGVTDGTNSWTTNSIYAGPDNKQNESYVINATANSSGKFTINTSGSGDCTHNIYDFAGAPSSLSLARANFGESGTNNNAFSSGTWSVVPFSLFAGGALDSIGTSLPFSSGTSITVLAGGETDNTTIGVSTPSGCVGDVSIQGGESINGPWHVDQNNPFAHCYTSTAPVADPLLTMASSSTVPNATSVDMLTFYSSGFAITNSVTAQGTSATFLAATVPSTVSGDLFVVNLMVQGTTPSKVCLGGNSTCGTGTQLTECSSCAVTTASHGNTSIWYTTSAPSGDTQIDAVGNASASNLELETYELHKFSGGSWSVDGGNSTLNSTAGSATITGPAFTTTGTDFCSSNISVGNRVNNAPAAADTVFVYGGQIWTTTTDGVASMISTSTGSKGATFTDNISGDSFSGSIQCFK